MSFTKTYFLCPTSDFIHPPPVGPLCLGSIIRSTATPHLPLNKANIVPIANENPPVLETDWKRSISAETALGVGIYAQFLQLATGGLGLGPEVDVERSNQTANTFAFENVTTVSFEPTSEYIEEAIKAPAVRAWLRQPKQRFAPFATLFLVTGMKLVKGANIKYSTSASTAVTGNIGIDVPAFGMALGPKGHWSRKNDDETEFNRDSEFVFAFRVKRLRFGLKHKAEDYNRGAFLSTGKDEEDESSVMVEDVDGSEFKDAMLVPDEVQNGSIFCIPAEVR